MKLVMTLLVRDEADIVDEQIAFHLGAGVDFVIATDNLSEDGTTEILERYAREGHLHLIREGGDDLRQTEWVTRMARLAATDFAADWVLNTDADEFWWPQGSGLKDVLAVVPQRYGVVRAAWRNFVPRPDDDRPFAERMTVRLCTPAFHHHPLSTHSKSAHRAVPDIRIGRGNHEAFGEGLLPLRGWYPIEILHFPVRSLEHCVRKYVTQFVALEKNAEKGIPNHMAEAHRAYRVGRLEAFYEPLVVDDDALERGLADGTLALDTRLRDALRALGFGNGADAPDPAARHGFEFGRPTVHDAALYAAESTALQESDVALALGTRIEDLESRVGRLERRALSRLRAAVRGDRRS
jgi:glycosyl transferase family 2